MERVAGIEPASSAWKAEVLPLNYTRKAGPTSCSMPTYQANLQERRLRDLVVGAGFEPAKLSRQIYSLIPLAAREPHQVLRYSIQEQFNVKPLPCQPCRKLVLFSRPEAQAYISESNRRMQRFCSFFPAFSDLCTRQPASPKNQHLTSLLLNLSSPARTFQAHGVTF